ncbi:MAG: HD domain-containing protein [Acetobacteraceae bacterium]
MATRSADNGDPYITHPVAVANILAGYHLDTGSIVTALLHDVVEDTGVKLSEIERRFGKPIAGLWDGVTKLTRLEAAIRPQQAGPRTSASWSLAMSRDIRVLLVKLADRLHNMRTLHFVQSLDRSPAHRAPRRWRFTPRLAERIGMDAVKTELQTPCFRAIGAGSLRHHQGPAELPARQGRRRHRAGAGTT